MCSDSINISIYIYIDWLHNKIEYFQAQYENELFNHELHTSQQQ